MKCVKWCQQPLLGMAIWQGDVAHVLWLQQGMELLVDYDYVAIFDADFKPDSDFLVRLLPNSCKLEAACMHAWPALFCCSADVAIHARAQEAAIWQAAGRQTRAAPSLIMKREGVPADQRGPVSDRQPQRGLCPGALGLHKP